jgi:hypothetical protein
MTVPGTSEVAGYALGVAPQPVVLTPEDIFHPSDVQLPNETATDGSRHFMLAVPPAELDNAGLRRDGTSSSI